MNLALALFLSVFLITLLGSFWVYAHYFHRPKAKLTAKQAERMDEMQKVLNKVSLKVGIQPS